MKRSLVVGAGLFCLTLGGCAFIKVAGDFLFGGGGSDVAETGKVIAAATGNAPLALAFGVIGGVLTAIGEIKKKAEGR